MSLLMDALKKAEAAKRQGAEETAIEEIAVGDPKYAELSLQPIGPSLETDPVISGTDNRALIKAESSPENLPKLPTHLGQLDAEFVAHHEEQKAASKSPVQLSSVSNHTAATAPSSFTAAKKSKTVATVSTVQTDRDAARNVFDVKAKAPPAGNKKFAIAMGALTFIVTLVAVGYFWWQLQPKSGFAGASVAVRPVAPVTPPAAAVVVPTTAGTSAVTATPALGAANQTLSGGTPLGQATAPSAAAPAVLTPGPVTIPLRAETKKQAQAATDNIGDDGVRLVRVSKSPLKINPGLINGFENFNRGDFAAAKADYESVLKTEPQNIDALHGLAAIAVREGRQSLADHFYERILVADPKDAAAMSAMINQHRQNNPVAAESRLQAIAAEQPGASSPQFALGNLYASQKRWGDAQQAYFKAYSADADNPDILYNLAVSLEHMNQAKLAYQYYSLALEAAMRRPAGFDMAVAGARAAALKP